MRGRLHRSAPLECDKRPSVVIVVGSMRAEGGTRIALGLATVWKAAGIRVVVSSLSGAYMDLWGQFERLGIECVSLNVMLRGTMKSYIQLFKAGRLLVNKYEARAMLIIPDGWHSFLAAGARCGGVKHVVVHLGRYPEAHSSAGLWKYRGLFYVGRPFTDVIACCSWYVMEGAKQNLWLPQSELEVIWNGCEMERIIKRAEASRSGIGARAPRGLMVGRLDETKDYDTLLAALPKVLDIEPRFELWLAGDGPARERLTATAVRLRCAHALKLLGTCQDIAEALGQVTVFIYMALPGEGFGVALIEAMAAGVPVVASDVGACREVLDNGELGLLVPPADPAALARAILALHDDWESAQVRAERARAKVSRVFTIERMAGEYARVLGLYDPP